VVLDCFIQGNLRLEGKAQDIFFKSVNISERRMFYTSFWKLGTSVFTSKNFF
jgi:hypothetical protein